jgi:enoyl-CoA hydratase/carnithine racemase
MPTGLIDVARDGHIATVTINRPDRRNAITNEMMEDIEQVAKAFAKDEQTRAIIVRAEGRDFSIGADLTQNRFQGDPQSIVMRRRGLELGGQMMRALQEIHQPTICAVQGIATGGGACIATACDFRIGAADAPTLQSWGFFDEVAPRENLDSAARAMAEEYAALPPIAVQMIKRSINRVAGALDQAIMHADADQWLLAAHSQDFREAVSAFFEKRKPTYTGN